MEITVSRKLVIILIAIVALVIGAVFVVPPLLGRFSAAAAPTLAWVNGTPLPAKNLPQDAAAQFAKAFYTANYQDPQGWLASFNKLTTEDGYTILEESVAPALWPKFVEAKTVTASSQVSVTDQGVAVEGFSQIGGLWQIRILSITIAQDALWPTMISPTFTAFVMLGQQDGEWRFVSFSSQQQIDQLKQSTGGSS